MTMHPLLLPPPIDGSYPPAEIPEQPETERLAPGAATIPADAETPSGTSVRVLGALDGDARNPDPLPVRRDPSAPIESTTRGLLPTTAVGVDSRPVRHPTGSVILSRIGWPVPRGNDGLKAGAPTLPVTARGDAGDPRPQLGNSLRAAPNPWDSEAFLGYVPVEN